MAKRGEEQINKDNPGDDNGDGSWGATSGLQKATAVQLAKRSPYAIETLVKATINSHIDLVDSANSPMKRARIDTGETEEEVDAIRENNRIAQPRGGRRTPATGTRRPLPSPSPALSNQQQLPAFGQANGTQSSQPGSGFAFGQPQPSASASFPPFGSSSNFTPPSSSFSFGSQLSSNPFSTNPTFGGSTEKSTQSAPANISFLQPANTLEANEAAAGLNSSAATPNFGGFSFDKSFLALVPGTKAPPQPKVSPKKPPPPRLHLRPPKPQCEEPNTWAVDSDGYPVEPAGPKGSSKGKEREIPGLGVNSVVPTGQENTSKEKKREIPQLNVNPVEMVGPSNSSKGKQREIPVLNVNPISEPKLGGILPSTPPLIPTELTSSTPKQAQPALFVITPPADRAGSPGFAKAPTTIPGPTSLAYGTGSSGLAEIPMTLSSKRTHTVFSQDDDADAMDTEATPGVQTPSDSSTQSTSSVFDNAAPAASGIFGSRHPPQVSQGLRSFQISPPRRGPPRYPAEEMDLDLPSIEDTLTQAMRRTSIEEDSIETNDVEIEDVATTSPAQNPFQLSGPSQSSSTIFANTSTPASSQFSFGQPNASAQPLPTSSSPFTFGQPSSAVSTHPQPSSPFASAFGQPSTAAQLPIGSNSDVMMISPEKNANGPLGKSLFDRIERPPTDASSSPASTSTAPPPAFSFSQAAFPTADFKWNSRSSFNGSSSIEKTSFLPSPGIVTTQNDPFTQSTTPKTSLFGQTADGQVTQPNRTPQPPSPTRAERVIAEPKMHVEDKPVHGNPFSNLLPRKEQLSASPSSAALSPFAPLAKASTTPTIATQSVGGLFGTSANHDGYDTEKSIQSSHETPNAHAQVDDSVLSGPIADHSVIKDTNSNSAEAQSSSSNNTGMFNSLNPLTKTVNTPQLQPKEQNEGTGSHLKLSDAAQTNDGQQLRASSKPTNAYAHTATESDQRIGSRRQNSQPAPPETWTIQEKRQYYKAYKIKQLEVGAKAKLLAIISENRTDKIKYLKRFYRKAGKNIRAADGGTVKPVTRSPSPPTGDSEKDDEGSRWPPISRASRKRSHDQQDGNLSTSADLASENHSAHYGSSQQEEDPSRNGKRARLIESQQVSYPSLQDGAPKSNTSSMFKTILDRPVVMTNGESSIQSSASLAKSSTTPSSVLHKSNGDLASESAANPFADSIAKWRSDASTDTSNDESTVKKSANTSSLFAIKPVTPSVTTSAASETASLKPPTFTQAISNDFLGQFGRSSKDRAREEMEKRKADDMDSDDDEAEWERQDAEQQRAKKQRLEQEASKLRSKFVPGNGFMFETIQEDSKEPLPVQDTPDSVGQMNELDRQHAEYAKQRAAAANAPNPFAQFAKKDSGNEGSKNEDADDEQGSSDAEDKQATAADKPSGGSLFDRITAPSSRAEKNADSEHPEKAPGVGVNMFGQISGAAASIPKFNTINKAASPTKANPFGKLPSSTPSQNVFGTPASAHATKSPESTEKGDNTWNPESPIKFGSVADTSSKKRTRESDDTNDGRENAKRADVKNAPIVNVISPSPTKAPSNLLFGTSHITSAETPSKMGTQPSTVTPAGAFGSSFGFEISPFKPGPALGSLFPSSKNPSNGVSRSTSPGATTGESATESNADGEDEEAEKHEQLNLTSGGPGEEDEDVLYEVRAKASIWEEKENEKGEKIGGWETRGLGPFRILKNRNTNKARMLMRSDPAGRIIINSSIFKQFKYDAPTKSTCRLPMLSASQKLENWAIKIGKESDAAQIAKILEENKDQT